jgi:hypothetical protein
MTDNPTRTSVELEVFNFGENSGAVSSLMGVEPTKAWVKGDRYLSGSPAARRTHSRWSLSSGLRDTEPLEAHLVALLAKLEPLQSQLDQLKLRYSAQIGIAQYFYAEVNPQFRLEIELLGRLARLGLPLYFDQYCLGPDADCESDGLPEGRRECHG